jgi:hypothetical protein
MNIVGCEADARDDIAAAAAAGGGQGWLLVKV